MLSAVTETLPPSPGPKFLTEMMPPLMIDKEPALTMTVPALRPFAELAWEKIPPELSIVSGPVAVTLTLPASPAANVLPEI
jgi:hypothetical protein